MHTHASHAVFVILIACAFATFMLDAIQFHKPNKPNYCAIGLAFWTLAVILKVVWN